MRAIVVIPARLSSTRLPRKLLLDETGLPLICHTLETAAAACALAPKRFTEALVATDDEEIYAAVQRHAARRGLTARAVMTRPDHASGSDRVAEAVAELPDFIETVVNLQGDEPELDPAHIVRLAERLGEGKDGPALATLAYPIVDGAMYRDPGVVKVVVDNRGEALYFSRAPIPHLRDSEAVPADALGHVGIYAYGRRALQRYVGLPPGRLEQTEKLEQLRALENGMKIAVEILPTRPAPGVDTPADYAAFVARQAARAAE